MEAFTVIFGTILVLVAGQSNSEPVAVTQRPPAVSAALSGSRRNEPPPLSSTSGSTSSLLSPSWGAVEEFCDWEAVNVTCPDDDHVIVVRNARYGRLRLGRCVAKNYGHLGCGADVTSRLEAACSAKRRCHLSVISLHGTLTSCPSDLKAYIQLNYDCVKGD